MKVYSCEFKGHWPVGTAAVVVADSAAQAALIMAAALGQIGLAQDIGADHMTLIDTTKAAAHILLDGDY